MEFGIGEHTHCSLETRTSVYTTSFVHQNAFTCYKCLETSCYKCLETSSSFDVFHFRNENSSGGVKFPLLTAMELFSVQDYLRRMRPSNFILLADFILGAGPSGQPSALDRLAGPRQRLANDLRPGLHGVQNRDLAFLPLQ